LNVLALLHRTHPCHNTWFVPLGSSYVLIRIITCTYAISMYTACVHGNIIREYPVQWRGRRCLGEEVWAGRCHHQVPSMRAAQHIVDMRDRHSIAKRPAKLHRPPCISHCPRHTEIDVAPLDHQIRSGHRAEKSNLLSLQKNNLQYS
jgi:hypothetical protein